LESLNHFTVPVGIFTSSTEMRDKSGRDKPGMTIKEVI